MPTRPTPSLFPTFLLPSLPFRRRLSSQDSTSSTTSSASTASTTSSTQPGQYLAGSTSHLRCGRCSTDLCLTTQIISKGFTGRYGRAYLVSPTVPYSYSYTSNISPHSTSTDARDNGGTLPNIHTHKPVPRQLVTGAHVVSDISCAFCGCVLGWKYVGAEEDSQRYKVGKFILETKRVRGSVYWENELEDSDLFSDSNYTAATTDVELVATTATSRYNYSTEADWAPPPTDRIDRANERDEVEFDSQDEDECEDLFAGVWNPTLASKRRKNKLFGRG